MSQNSDRSGALLSKKQREFLLGAEVSDIYSMRHRIRDRIRNSFLDFSLLLKFQSDEQRAKTFEQSEREPFYERLDELDHSRFHPNSISTSDLYFVPGIRDAIAYFYLALQDQGYENIHFEEIVRTAVKKAAESRDDDDRAANVTVSIDVSFHDKTIEKLRNQFRKGEDLSEKEIQTLLDADPDVIVKELAGGVDRFDGEE